MSKEVEKAVDTIRSDTISAVLLRVKVLGKMCGLLDFARDTT